MSFFDRKLINAGDFALLRHEGKNERFNSLKEAKAAWDKLPPGQQPHATIVADGTLYTPPEIVSM